MRGEYMRVKIDGKRSVGRKFKTEKSERIV